MVQLKRQFHHYVPMREKLKASIRNSPIIDRNGYPYLIHPVTDGVPRMDPDVLDEIVDWILTTCDLDCDVILAPESMGIPLAVPVSLRTRIPYLVIRKRSYGIEGEIPIHYRTGYSDRSIYVNGLKAGDRVVVIDDILSTGGTLSALTRTLQDNGIIVVDILVVFNKGSRRDELSRELGIDIKRMIDIEFNEKGELIVTDP